MKATKSLFAIKALVLAVPFVIERDLIRDLLHDLARARELARELSFARAFARELTDVYNLAYKSDLQNAHEESE